MITQVCVVVVVADPPTPLPPVGWEVVVWVDDSVA